MAIASRHLRELSKCFIVSDWAVEPGSFMKLDLTAQPKGLAAVAGTLDRVDPVPARNLINSESVGS